MEIRLAEQSVNVLWDETAKFFYEKLGYGRIGAFLPPEQDAEEILYLKILSM